MEASELKALRDKLNLNQQEFAAKVGIALRTLHNLETGQTKMSKGVKMLIENALKEPMKELVVEKNEDQIGIPILPGVHTTGSNITLFRDEHNEEPLFYLDAPQVKGCDYGVVVSGSSMYPLIPNGSYVACKTIIDKHLILFGEIYHVITKDYSTVKYVHPHPTKEDHVMLVPYSDSAKPTAIKRKEIIKISQVRAILQVI